MATNSQEIIQGTTAMVVEFMYQGGREEWVAVDVVAVLVEAVVIV